MPDGQAVPSATGVPLQAPLSQVSVVHAFPSSQVLQAAPPLPQLVADWLAVFWQEVALAQHPGQRLVVPNTQVHFPPRQLSSAGQAAPVEPQTQVPSAQRSAVAGQAVLQAPQ